MNYQPLELPTNSNGRALISVGPKGVELKDVDSMFRFAKCYLQSNLAPASFKNEQQLVIAWAKAAELGLSPLQAVEGMSIINNRVGIMGDLALAMVEASGQLEQKRVEYSGERDSLVCTVTLQRRGREPQTYSFSVKEARAAGIYDRSSDDERLGLPSGSTFERLTKCAASHLLSQKARELGQVAHETSHESERGTSIHKAYELQNSDGLSASDAADYEAIMAQREEITAAWLPNGQPVMRIVEERLWLHRGLRPIFSGKVDELLLQNNRALLFDLKTGRGEVDPPATNLQLRIYAMLARVRWPELESVTAAILSPHYQYTSHEFNVVELDAIRDETLQTLARLDFQAAPKTGEWCKWCEASMICPLRRTETYALAVPVQELPTGAEAARLLETVVRVEAMCDEIKLHYKAQLEADPTCVPGWRLQSSMRRWIPDPAAALERLIEQFSIREFLGCTSIKVADLETAWGRKNNITTAQVRARFDRCMQGIIQGKRTAPSLRQATKGVEP